MRACKACVHPKRNEIEDLLLRKTPHSKIGEQYGISLYSVFRHSKHLGRSIVCAGDRPLMDRLEALLNRLEQISEKAQSAKAWSATVSAMREVRETLELIARLTGEYPLASQGVRVGVSVNVATGHPANNLGDRDLELQLAMDVSEATNDFDPATIAKLQRLVQKNRIGDGMLLEMETASSRQGS